VLCSRPGLAGHIRSFEIHYKHRRSPVYWLASFVNLLRRSLGLAKNLTSLTLLLPGCPSRVLSSTLFQLTDFATSVEWDSALAEFLLAQPSIRAIAFSVQPGLSPNRAFALDRFARHQLNGSSLPLLDKVSASPLVLSRIVPKRPVVRVEVMFDPWMFTSEILLSTCKILAFSTGPLKSLGVTGHIPHAQPAEETLNILAAIPETLPDLEVLDVCAVTGPIHQVRARCLLHISTDTQATDARAQDVLVGLPNVLARFNRLLALVIMSQVETDAVHDHTLTSFALTPAHSLAQPPPAQVTSYAGQFLIPPHFLPLLTAFSYAQPALNCVSFPTVTYVKTKSLGWVDIVDLRRIVKTRREIISDRERQLYFVNKRLEELEEQRLGPS
jgi:hypothetical protein